MWELPKIQAESTNKKKNGFASSASTLDITLDIKLISNASSNNKSSNL